MNWTYRNVGEIWPNASKMFQIPPTPSGREYLKHFLVTVQSSEVLAYECLRLARWGEGTGLRVTCPRCGKVAWNKSSDEAKHRWRCVTKSMYEKHQNTKGYKPAGHSRNGCGFTFYDTKGTPFERLRIPLGLVFLSLYLPAKEVDAFLRSLRDEVTATALTKVLRKLQHEQHGDLRHRMRCLARYFCGRLLWGPHNVLLSRSGEKLLRKKMYRSMITHRLEQAEKKEALSELPKYYKKIRSLLGQFERMQFAVLHDRPVDIQRGLEIYQSLMAEVVALAPRKAA